MLKILYVADNRPSSFYSLKRFVDTYSSFYQIKTAAYSTSIQQGTNVHWTLDALLDWRGLRHDIGTTNSNYQLYAREIKRFAPNLIISDLELYTSHIGIELGVPVWQVSPLLLHHGVPGKTDFYKYHAATFARHFQQNRYLAFVLHNSARKLVCSHLGDVLYPPSLDPTYEWVRPNYELTDIERAGCGIHFADAYYAGKSTILNTNYTDPESIVTSYYNKRYELSADTVNKLQPFEINLNTNVQFLSQYLEQLDI